MSAVILAMLAAAQQAPAEDNRNPGAEPVEGATEAVLAFDRLIGRWHPDPESLSQSYREWMAANQISDSWIEFQWGTDRRWIDFSDWRMLPSGARRQGEGIIAYDHGRHVISFHEHGAREVTVTGTLEFTDPQTIVRDVAIIGATGGFRQVATWRWDTGRPDCFTWTATQIRGETRNEGAPVRYCRRTD